MNNFSFCRGPSDVLKSDIVKTRAIEDITLN